MRDRSLLYNPYATLPIAVIKKARIPRVTIPHKTYQLPVKKRTRVLAIGRSIRYEVNIFAAMSCTILSPQRRMPSPCDSTIRNAM